MSEDKESLIIDPKDLAEHLNRGSSMLHFAMADREYTGQPQTCEGDRGKVEVHGVTFRDVYDCIALAFGRTSGLPEEQWMSREIYAIDVDIDPIALCQNACVLLRERMRNKGIDVPEPESVERFIQQFKDELEAADEESDEGGKNEQ